MQPRQRLLPRRLEGEGRRDLLLLAEQPDGRRRDARAQLQSLVDHANKQGSIIVFDAAYAPFIRSGDVPKSIFEIDGARTCAIEVRARIGGRAGFVGARFVCAFRSHTPPPARRQVNSFSKYAGFTGVRLGWTIVPKELTFADGSSVKADYNRVMSTCFNGASNIVQRGAMSCLDKEGLAEIKKLIDYYMENGAPRAILEFGGARRDSTRRNSAAQFSDGAPTLLTPPQRRCSSRRWRASEVHDVRRHRRAVRLRRPRGQVVVGHLPSFESSQVVTIPGAGFGPGGEGFLRLSASGRAPRARRRASSLKKAAPARSERAGGVW